MENRPTVYRAKKNKKIAFFLSNKEYSLILKSDS